MTSDTLALVGAVGGAGTTRVTLECATALAGDGRDVAVLDAAYETQGLADRTPGRISPDITELCLEDDHIEEGLIDRDIDGAGRLAVCPARAPFERLARAKAPEAAEAFERRIGEASRIFDHVLVDVPPIAANQAVAAVNAVDRVAVVCDDDRAADAVPRMCDRLADVGIEDSTTVLTHTDGHPDADVAVPTFDAELSVITEPHEAHKPIGETLERTLDVSIATEEADGIHEKLPL